MNGGRAVLTGLVGGAVVCLCLGLAPPAAGSAEIDFDYDIFLAGDTLTLWLDVAPLLTQPRLEDLLAGLDVSIKIDVDVQRPRKLFFPATLASVSALVVISHPIAEDIYRLRIICGRLSERIFKSQLALSDFLADSLVLPLVPAQRIRGQGDLRLSFSLLSKSHSINMLDKALPEAADSVNQPPGDDQFLESLFSTFLRLVGFGASSYQVTTPTFSPDELPSI